ncbi:alpha/beta hydrolase [Marivibrio halodurans]|uniref:Alpha/beta hydrolase n=1 Tax=Marivibrio halodurans TaxID=2039722 RepID=A0A8J7S7S3_9PROT|nr:alpha/beta hydrolase [Marivibrio halodurans]MBP5858384.1 alpha/beta hydrolase [Marivibrio halodurans]
MHFVDVAGTPTRCIIAGDEAAPTILFIHGLALTAEVWLRNIDALARTHRVIAPDMLGHGFTKPADDATVDVPAKIRHLRKLVDTLGIDRLSLCGSSYGALMASLFFLDNKDRVEKLVINGSGSCFNTEAQLQAQVTKLRDVFGPEKMASSSIEEWHQRIGNNFHDTDKVPRELLHIAQLCYAYPWAARRLSETMAVMQEPERFRPFRILERLEELTCPTLVVWGRDDRGGSLESAQEAIKRLPNGDLTVFDACGHYPMIEHPKRYNETVGAFLAKG